jgi:1-acyl-sn-glycerol-3-phosphate acyltransferase
MELQHIAPRVPPRVARAGGEFGRWFGCAILRLVGWRITGQLPDTEKMIVIAAPHTSNWDWALAMPSLFALGVRINYLIKDTAFWWPASLLLKATGGIPVNRREPAGMAEDVSRRIREAERIIMVITPEGTRARVEKWKTGFLRIAQLAEVPVVQLSWDYPSRTIHLGPVAEVSGDFEADIARIRAYFRAFTGRNPENQSP